MPIEAEKINVALAVNDQRITIVVRRSDGAPPEPNWVSWDLRDIEREGYLALCERVGNAVVRMLDASHPDLFAQHPLLMPPRGSSFDDTHDLILELMTRSIREKTLEYAPAIEALFRRDLDNITHTNLADIWESYKLRIEHHLTQQ